MCVFPSLLLTSTADVTRALPAQARGSEFLLLPVEGLVFSSHEHGIIIGKGRNFQNDDATFHVHVLLTSYTLNNLFVTFAPRQLGKCGQYLLLLF